LTRELLGWPPVHPGLIEDLERGTTFTVDVGVMLRPSVATTGERSMTVKTENGWGGGSFSPKIPNTSSGPARPVTSTPTNNAMPTVRTFFMVDSSSARAMQCQSETLVSQRSRQNR
jgi:hypothetical protein